MHNNDNRETKIRYTIIYIAHSELKIPLTKYIFDSRQVKTVTTYEQTKLQISDSILYNNLPLVIFRSF